MSDSYPPPNPYGHVPGQGTPPPPEHVSDDGHWVWNGSRWVPNPAAPSYHRPAPQAEVPSYFSPGPSPDNPYGAAPAAASLGYPSSYGYALHITYASWIKRFAAYLLDGLLLLPFYAVAFIAMTVSTTTTADQVTDPSTGEVYFRTVGPSGAGLIVALVAWLSMFAFAIWNQWIRQGRTGYSLGKQWLGIRLVKDSSALEAPGIGLNIGRSFAHILDAVPCYLGYLWPLWDAKSQTWADKVCNTVVIDQARD